MKIDERSLLRRAEMVSSCQKLLIDLQSRCRTSCSVAASKRMTWLNKYFWLYAKIIMASFGVHLFVYWVVIVMVNRKFNFYKLCVRHGSVKRPCLIRPITNLLISLSRFTTTCIASSGYVAIIVLCTTLFWLVTSPLSDIWRSPGKGPQICWGWALIRNWTFGRIQ